MPTKKSADGTYTVTIPAIITGTLEVTIEGVTPLIVNRFDPISITAPDPNAKKKPRLDPEEIIAKKLYPHPLGGYGFPSSGIKIAMVSAGQRFADQKRTELYGVFGIPEELVHIDADAPEIREDRVVLAGMNGMRRKQQPNGVSCKRVTLPAHIVSSSMRLQRKPSFQCVAPSMW